AVRAPAQCKVQPAAPTPQPPATGPAPTPRPAPPTPDVQEHEVWLEDATSVAGKLQIATRYGLGGVGAWRLGQEDPGVWPELAGYRSGK
ncbi:MAG TPA: hypothetical protein VHS06_05895, partial [Chloroflexota bacterium]|nr:hypothetical protein [Chloroflexota bacterium]